MFARAGITQLRLVESLVRVLRPRVEHAHVTRRNPRRSRGILAPVLLETDEGEEERHDLTSLPGEDAEVRERREREHERPQDAKAVRGVRGSAQLAAAEGRTVEAGSSFTPVRVNTPIDLPYATITVLFRPFPWETHNGQTIVTSLEGLFLIVLTVRGWRRLRSIPGDLRREPYVAYCLGIMFTFVYAFSSFSNFGILARQRCQVLPFFLVLICLEQHKPKDPARPSGTEPGDMTMLAVSPENPFAFDPEKSEPGAEPPAGEHG
jgi:hypothetical protein